MMSYEPKNKILFSGDAFGGFGSLDGGIFDDTVDIEYYESEILRYFSNIVGKFSPMVQKAIGKLKNLEINIVASTHGPIWRSRPERIIGLYDRWSRHQTEEGIVVAYGSMYGNTEKMMEGVVRGVAKEGLHAVRVHNVARTHASFVISDIWRYGGLILGSPTYDARLLPQMESLVSLLADKMLRNHCVGVFGSCGWSGGGVRSLEAFATRAGLQLVEPVIEAKFAPTAEQLEKCVELGRAVACATLRGKAD
jgi:flavorubredoxin